jgi:hypothetical protein
MDKTNNTIAGLRFQKYDSGEVHVHDDSKNIKFVSSTAEFKKDVKQALKDLLASGHYGPQDGAVVIEGTSKERLVLIRDGKNLSASVISDQNIISELQSFCNTL